VKLLKNFSHLILYILKAVGAMVLKTSSAISTQNRGNLDGGRICCLILILHCEWCWKESSVYGKRESNSAELFSNCTTPRPIETVKPCLPRAEQKLKHLLLRLLKYSSDRSVFGALSNKMKAVVASCFNSPSFKMKKKRFWNASLFSKHYLLFGLHVK